MLEILASSAYAPDEPLGTADAFRRQLIEILITEGDLPRTKVLAAEIEEPDVLLQLVSDPRYRAIVPADFDERRAVEKALAKARAAMQRFDDQLRPYFAVAGHLRKLGRYQEALDVMLSALKRNGGLEGYADASHNLIWWWDSLSRSHLGVGNTEAAVSDLRQGMQLKEDGAFNVSLTINLAQMLLELGRPQEALDVLTPSVVAQMSVSPYGAMQIHTARGCALIQAGKEAEAAADLAYAREHEGDDPSAAISLLLCRGDIDSAAAALIRRLDNPETRADALYDLIEFDDPPPPPSKNPATLALPVLIARSDVAAAIARAGGRRRIHLHDAEW